jgi:hypothetical protein
MAASAALLLDSPVTQLAISLFLLVLFAAVTLAANPYAGKFSGTLLVAKDSAFFLVFVLAAAMHLSFSSSIDNYLALGWGIAVLVLLLLGAELAFGIYLYLLVLSTSHRRQTTEKVTQYYERLILEGRLSEKEINALVVDGNLNQAVGR